MPSPSGPNERKIRSCADRLGRRILRLLRSHFHLRTGEIAQSLDEPVHAVVRRMTLHEGMGTVDVVDTRKVLGATERFWASLVADDELVNTMLDATEEEDEEI